MKIAFVNDSCERIGVEYISAVLKLHGHRVKLFNDPQLFDDENVTFRALANLFDYKNNIVAGLKEYKPDLICFSVVTDFYQWACQLAKLIKSELNVPILFGGIHATSVPENVIINDFVDMVCRGEGEYALLDLANSMQNGTIDHNIKNIWFKKSGEIIRNDVRPLIENLDSLPFPDKSLFYEASPHFSKCYFLMTNRGCAYACSYCSNSFMKKFYKDKGTYLRFRSVQNVIDELVLAKEKYGVTFVRIHDDDFLTHDIKWFEEFADKYRELIKVPFACFTHPNTVTPQKAKLLKKSGCHDIELGIQSISSNTRHNIMNRPVTDQQLRFSIKTLQDSGIKIITDNILGMPNQDPKEIIDLLKFYNENRVMKIYCFGFRHYPATDIIEYSRKESLLSDKDIENLENGVDVKTFIQSGDILSFEDKQLQTYFAFLLYLPKRLNDFILKHKLYKLIIPLPYFIHVIFSNWLRIPFKYNWALHITISRYSHYVPKKLFPRPTTKKAFYIDASTFCMERMLDCQKISDYLKANKWIPVNKASRADLVIVSTCSFGKEEDASSIDYLKYYLKKKRDSTKLVVAGCISSINPDLVKQLGELHFLSPTNISQLDDIINPEILFNDIPEPNIVKAKEVKHSILFKKRLSLKSSFKKIINECSSKGYFLMGWVNSATKGIKHFPVLKSHINPFLTCNRNEFYYLRISKGCIGDCSYCAKRYSTGRLKSKPISDIVSEFKSGLKNGHKKYYLLTEDSGCYGLDRGNTIIELLTELFEAGKNEIFQIAISNFNSRWFIKYYAELEPLLVDNQDKILYIQIPIQSASNTILESMNRHTRIEDLQKCLLSLREKAPTLKITTDIIVGFPGESDNDFELTREFIEMIKFDYIDIFAYERRPNTTAERLKNHLSQEVITKRELVLAELQNSFNNSSSLFKKLIEITKENLQRYK